MKHPIACLAALAAALVCTTTAVRADSDDCDGGPPQISFIEFKSPDITVQPVGSKLFTVKGKLSLPGGSRAGDRCGRGGAPAKLPAVLILHGSSGVDSRGDFYEAALNAAGIATLQIDMWEARGVTGLANRPKAPILTYPDAFAALGFLATQARIDPERIGVLGFSWGGVVSLASSELLYQGMFGAGRKFAAHVANYPVCYGANNTSIPALSPPAQVGTQLLHLTGKPVLIQIGSNDSYDNGTGPCKALVQAVNPANNNVVQLAEYPGAYHAWDRLMVPITGLDPFANQGSYFSTGVLPAVQLVPDVAQAETSRKRVVKFFRQSL